MISGGAFPIFPIKTSQVDKDPFHHISKEQILSARISFINHSPGRIPKIRSKTRVAEDNEDLPSGLSPNVKEMYMELLSLLEAALPSRKAEILLFIEKERKIRDDKNIIQILAKVIFLIDNDRLKRLDNLQGDTDIFLGTLVHEMKQEFGHLPELEIRTHLSRAFATMLVTSTGQINFGLIPSLTPIFRHFESSGSDFASSFENALEMLYTQSALRVRIESLKKPKKELTTVRELIRVTLGINRKRIGSVDAKRTLLTALFSYPKQENVGNCFAISLAISLFSNSIMKCVDDFIEILNYGCLKRVVENEQVSFPFLMKTPVEHAKKPLPPNFQNDPFFKSLKEYLKFETWPEGAKTVEELLKLIEKQKPGSLERGRFFVEAKTKNPLITVWGNILASMAEGGSETLLKTALTGSLLHIASPYAKEPILTQLKKTILDRIHIHYDPEIESAGDTNGAFVLYDKTRDWKRIDDPTKFHHFVLHAINNPDLKSRFKKKSLMIELLKVYHPDNSIADKSYKDMTDLPFTPWVTKIGNDPKQLLKIYKGATQTELTVLFHPHQTSDLLEMVLKTSRNYFEKRNDSKKRHSSLMMPVRIVGQHTFNLIINHPSLTKWLLDSSKLYETLLEPARKVNSEPYDSTEILKYFNEKGGYKLKDPPLLLKDLRTVLLKTFPQDLVDKKLFIYLKPEQKKAIQETAIQFASTNWQSEDGKARHLAFAYNPASLNLEVFEALDDDQKTLLHPVDQDSQIKNAIWEFYKDPVI